MRSTDTTKLRRGPRTSNHGMSDGVWRAQQALNSLQNIPRTSWILLINRRDPRRKNSMQSSPFFTAFGWALATAQENAAHHNYSTCCYHNYSLFGGYHKWVTAFYSQVKKPWQAGSKTKTAKSDQLVKKVVCLVINMFHQIIMMNLSDRRSHCMLINHLWIVNRPHRLSPNLCNPSPLLFLHTILQFSTQQPCSVRWSQSVLYLVTLVGRRWSGTDSWTLLYSY